MKHGGSQTNLGDTPIVARVEQVHWNTIRPFYVWSSWPGRIAVQDPSRMEKHYGLSYNNSGTQHMPLI